MRKEQVGRIVFVLALQSLAWLVYLLAVCLWFVGHAAWQPAAWFGGLLSGSCGSLRACLEWRGRKPEEA